MSYRWEDRGNYSLLYYGQELIGEVSVTIADGMECSALKITEIETGIFEIIQEYHAEVDQDHFALDFDFISSYQSQWAMIPALSYNGNDWGKGKEPKGFIKDGVPWSFSYSRMSLPGGTYSEGQKWSVGLFGDIEQSSRMFSCSLIPKEDATIHRLSWPEAEYPETYYQRDKYQAGFSETIKLKQGETFKACLYLIVNPVEVPKLSYDKFLDFAWKNHWHQQEPWYSPDEIWQLGISYAKDTLYVEDGIFRGFSKGLRWNGESWYLRPTGKYLVGWTGQNFSLANSLIYNYILNGDRKDLEIGLNTFDSWAKHARLENGLIHCMFDPLLESEENAAKALHDACNLADAAVNLFEAWELLQECNILKEEYKEIALGICDFAVENQFEDGRFGKSWNNAGECVDPNGTIGAYLILPLLKAYRLTGKEQYFSVAKRGYQFYIESFLADGYTSAAALDTYCIDKESAIPLLKSSLLFYEIEKEDRYLQLAELVSYYLATWQWHYSTPFPVDTPLNDMNYDIFGGTSVSTQHHHIDPFAIVFLEQWLQLAKLTGNQIWQQRAYAIWANGSMGVSDGTLQVSGITRPKGSQDEGFYHTYWGAPNESTGNPMGNVSHWLVAWPTAFRLEVLRHLRDWEIMKEV